jgi:ABC-type ATPase with predicted acetyltransferase domain
VHEITIDIAFAAATRRVAADPNHDTTPGQPEGSHAAEVAAMFGLGVGDTRPVAIVPPTTLTLAPGIVFITGPSGGGKSTILRLIRAALSRRGDVRLVEAAATGSAAEGAPAGDTTPEGGGDSGGGGAIVDGFGVRAVSEVLSLLSRVGLSDAFVLLRPAGELSDGQRHRLALAHALAAAEQAGSTPNEHDRLTVVLADEFGSTLDRLTARVVARSVRKWARRAGVCFVAATAHDDLLEALRPDVLIEKGLGGAMTVMTRADRDRRGSDERVPAGAGAGARRKGVDHARIA